MCFEYSYLHVFRSGTDLVSLLILFFLLGLPSSKKPKATSFQIISGWNVNLAGLFFKLIRVDWRVGFLIWRHNCKMAGMTSFHAEKCRHLVSAHATYALPGGYAAASASSWSIAHWSFFLIWLVATVISYKTMRCHCPLFLPPTFKPGIYVL